MKNLSIDIETYSSVDIKKAGLFKYAQSPDFEILMFAYAVDFGEVKIIDLAKGEKLPNEVVEALADDSVIKHAYNAAFEWRCLETAGYPTPLKSWRCTMLRGLYCGYPAGLGVVGKALGLDEDKQKDRTGAALIKIFCSPTKPSRANGNRTRTLFNHEPDKWELFKDYCKQDVVSEMEILAKLNMFEVPEDVEKQWQTDIIMNDTGALIDKDLVEGAVSVEKIISDELKEKAKALTGLSNPNSTVQLKPWLEAATREPIADLTKSTVESLLESISDPSVREVLKIRQMSSKTSVKKYKAMEEAMGFDGRLRGMLQFYGANRTGRWAGRLVQVQNLTKNKTELLDLARSLVKEKNVEAIKLIFGDPLDLLSQLTRTAFIAGDGHKIISADFSAIEARVLAWLAKEKWRQEVFETHGKIYEASASAMFGVPIEKITKGKPEYELRQKGKIAELALGYGGSAGALVQMGALNMGLTEEELPEIVQRWRGSNKAITALWRGINAAAIEAVKSGALVVSNGIEFKRKCDFINGQDFLTIKLPSGRALFYAKPAIAENRFGSESVVYLSMNQTSRKWEKTETYGGKLVENITQAIARDCLAVAIERLVSRGHIPIFTVHDEVVLEEPNHVSVDDICAIMAEEINWAEGLKLPADGFESAYYKKD